MADQSQPVFPFSQTDLDWLTDWDTPTILNALELIAPERRHIGYTIDPMVASRPEKKTVIGLARTAGFRTQEPARDRGHNMHGFRVYLADSVWPTIAVVQDLDNRPGFGAIVGEVGVAVYKALGSVGYITNGSLRDTKAMDPDYQVLGTHLVPSHGHFHFVDWGREVKVCGMKVDHDDVVAIDYHGGIVIPHEAVRKLPAVIEKLAKVEQQVLSFVRGAKKLDPHELTRFEGEVFGKL